MEKKIAIPTIKIKSLDHQLKLKEITYETSHLLPLKHHLIRACMIGQEPLLATNQSTQDTLTLPFMLILSV